MHRFSLFQFCLTSLLLAGTTSALAGDKTSVNELITSARVQFFDGQYQEALATFEKAIAADPQNLEARLGKMDTLGALRKPLDGLAKSAATKQSPPAEALILDANEKIWKRQFEPALGDLNRAIEKDPNSYLAHYLAAFLHRRTRKFDQALQHLNRAYEIAPKFPETSYLMGEVHLAKGNTDEALKAFQRYLSMVPNQGKRFDSVTTQIRRIGGR